MACMCSLLSQVLYYLSTRYHQVTGCRNIVHLAELPQRLCVLYFFTQHVVHVEQEDRTGAHPPGLRTPRQSEAELELPLRGHAALASARLSGGAAGRAAR